MEALRASGRWEDLLPFGDPLEVLLNAIRPSLVPGYTECLTAGDESAIEARVLPWLAGDKNTLDIFRAGGDVYVHAAEGIYHRPLTKAHKEERQIGKVATLSLGFQGGKDAFRTMGRNYGVHVSPEAAEGIKVAWREAHPEIVAFWYALQDAAIAAIQRPGTEHHVGKLTFRHTGSALWLRLPSGGALCYQRAHLRMTTPKWEMEKPEELRKQKLTIAFYAPFGDNMVLDYTYGGKLAENATQAVARDVIGEALIREPALPYVLHAHDELVTEGEHMKRLDIALTTPIKWAPGLPLKADVHTMDRYHKED
jgi:DNA polymerase